MRKAWLNTFAALCCAAGVTASVAKADPASMAMPGHYTNQDTSSSIWPWSKPATPPAQQPVWGQAPQPQPPASHNPITYLKNKVSNVHFGSQGTAASAPRPSMPPATAAPTPVALNKPTAPPTPELFIYAAEMCENHGDVPQARQNYQRALNMWPGHVEVLRSAALMEDRQGNLPLAENLYRQAVTANPQHAGAVNDLGLCLARQGKLDQSLQSLEQAVQLQPTKALYRNNAATVLVEMHQDQRALAHLAAVHGPAEANYNLGQLLVARNRSAEAAPYFQAALQQNPAMLPAQEALAKLQGGEITASAPVATTAAPVVQPQTGSPIAPQQSQAIPQPNYPTTARVPAANPTTAVTPQYLPPVASRTAPVVR